MDNHAHPKFCFNITSSFIHQLTSNQHLTSLMTTRSISTIHVHISQPRDIAKCKGTLVPVLLQFVSYPTFLRIQFFVRTQFVFIPYFFGPKFYSVPNSFSYPIFVFAPNFIRTQNCYRTYIFFVPKFYFSLKF